MAEIDPRIYSKQTLELISEAIRGMIMEGKLESDAESVSFFQFPTHVQEAILKDVQRQAEQDNASFAKGIDPLLAENKLEADRKLVVKVFRGETSSSEIPATYFPHLPEKTESKREYTREDLVQAFRKGMR